MKINNTNNTEIEAVSFAPDPNFPQFVKISTVQDDTEYIEWCPLEIFVKNNPGKSYLSGIKLNLGSGGHEALKQGYINVDLYQKDADLIHDISLPFPYPDNFIESIHTSHAIEHLSRSELLRSLPEWHRILKIGGTIEIICPDLDTCIEKYLTEPENRDHWIKTIFGSQSSPGEFHKNGFNIETLSNALTTTGFKIISAQKIVNNQLDIIAKK